MGKVISEERERYGRLVVVEEAGRDKFRQVVWECLCDCGAKVNVRGSDLRNGHTKSCGCFMRDAAKERSTKHGFCGVKEYKAWQNMQHRCTDKNNISYQDYGGRGIKVCVSWSKFENFYKDMGKRPEGLTLERKNNELGYFKENCKWASQTEQNRNQRLRKTNKTGVSGIYWHEKSKRYQVCIWVNCKRIYIGTFKSLGIATMARETAENKYWDTNAKED